MMRYVKWAILPMKTILFSCKLQAIYTYNIFISNFSQEVFRWNI
jgi:hypothetical protein